MSQKRPSHNPSKKLSQTEIQCLYDLLGNNCVTLATAIAQIFYGPDNNWQKQADGVLCYVKDYYRRTYSFRLYNLSSKEILFEETTLINLSLEKVSDIFYTFDGRTRKIGIHFADQTEADTFCKHFHKKQQDRMKKTKDFQPLMPSVTNESKSTASDIAKMLIPGPLLNRTSKSKNEKYSKKKVNESVAISKPVSGSLIHQIHVGVQEVFITDETQKQLFEQVLTRMHVSPAEQTYIRRTISNTNDGLANLFTKSTTDSSHTHLPKQDNIHNRRPYQDISLPVLIYNQTNKSHSQLQNVSNTSTNTKQGTPPAVLPKPTGGCKTDNIQKSVKTRAPPPPLPINTPNQTQIPSTPSPPPLVSPKPHIINNQAQHSNIPPALPSRSSKSIDINKQTQPANMPTPPPLPSPKPANINNQIPHPNIPPAPPFSFPPKSTAMNNQTSHSNVPNAPPLPSPKPTDINNQTPTSLTPPAAPPLPPPMTFSLKPMSNESSKPSPTSESNSLLSDICTFDRKRLKSAPERSETDIKQPEIQADQTVQNTIEENIRKLLEQRRKNIMRPTNEDDQNNTTDEEWDT